MENSAGSGRSNPGRFIACCLFPILAVFAALPLWAAEPVPYKVNDRIESNLSVFGWQKGTVTELGQGEKAGQVKILTDGYASAAWVSVASMKFIRKIPGAAPAAAAGDTNQPPRLGKYEIFSFGPGGKNLFLGHLELLAGGKYRVSRTAEGNYFGEGAYVSTSPARAFSGPAVPTRIRLAGAGASKSRVKAKPTASGCGAGPMRRTARPPGRLGRLHHSARPEFPSPGGPTRL